jgi:hypothetical protein
MLYVTPTRIAYDPFLSPQFKKDAFEATRASLRNIKFEDVAFFQYMPGIHFDAPDRRYDFFFLYTGTPGPQVKTNKSLAPAIQDLLRSVLADFGTAKQTFEQATSDSR